MSTEEVLHELNAAVPQVNWDSIQKLNGQIEAQGDYWCVDGKRRRFRLSFFILEDRLCVIADENMDDAYTLVEKHTVPIETCMHIDSAARRTERQMTAMKKQLILTGTRLAGRVHAEKERKRQ